MQHHLRLFLAMLVLGSVTVAAAPVPPVDAAAEVLVSLRGSSTVLAGEATAYEVVTTNGGSDPAYNVSFRHVLPAGVAYEPGSTSPNGAGDPRVSRDPVTGVTTLTWSNVTDVQPGGRSTLAFRANPDPAVHPVGSTVTGQAQAFASHDPRVVPRFTSAGEPVAGSHDISATSGPSSTTISSIEVTASEPSPEGELLRGVHDNWTVRSLRVQTSNQGAHEDVVVIDFVPAALEFLACGGVDHSTVAGPPADGDQSPDPVAEEYPGSGPLGSFTVPGDDCLRPTRVETVSNPSPTAGVVHPPGVYTKVTWELGPLPAGTDRTITYAMGVPLRANVLFDDPPAPASLGQAANLDNNTGPSTRELATEASVTMVAVATGRFLGLVQGDDPSLRTVTDSHASSRTIEDVRMVKSARSDEFVVEGTATFDVVIETSEYADASDIVVTDLVPNGMCPLGGPEIPGCPPGGGLAPSVPYRSVTANPADGTFTIEFEPIPALAAGGSTTLTYHVGMRSSYAGGAPGAVPIASGDVFENRAALTATTNPIAGTGEAGPQEVGDDSAVRLGTGDVAVSKTMLPRSAGTASCPTDGLDRYTTPTEGDPDFRFGKGDLVCFRLRVSFAASTFTRNPVVTDFLPIGVDVVPGSAVATSANTVAFDVTGPVEPTFAIGDPVEGQRFVPPGGVFDVVLAGEVVGIPDGDLPDLRGNLMKLRVENTAGEARSLRAELPFQVAPAPRVGLVKGVAQVDAPASGPHGPGFDGATVQQGSQVTYRLDLTNHGDPATGTGSAVRGLEVWDLLPPAIRCERVSGITNFLDGDPAEPGHGACVDPGQPGYPLPAAHTASVIRWTFPTATPEADRYAIGWEAPTNQRTLTYTVTMPSPLSAGLAGPLQLLNRAGVRSFDAATNVDGVPARFIPADNVDPAVSPDDWDAPPADDRSSVVTAPTSVAKATTTSITELPGNGPTQAVIGELATHTYHVDVPAQATVFNGVLRDELPPNLVREGSATPQARFFPDAGDTAATGPLPAGFTLDPTTGTLTFPPAYTNSTATAQRFEVVLVTRVAAGTLSPNDQVTRSNTVRFTATSAAETASTPVSPQSATAQVQIRQPAPTLSSTNDAPGGVATGGSTVRFTLTAGNTATRPPLHDAFVADCIPAPLTFTRFAPGTPGPTFGPEPGGAANGCPTGTTYVAFGLGSLAGGTTTQRSYDVFVPETVVGGDTFTDQARSTGSSLDDDQATPQAPANPHERRYEASATSSFRVQGAGLVKSAQPQQATIGDEVTYTVRLTVPAQQTFYDLAVIDDASGGLTDVTLVSSTCTTGPAPSEPCDLDVVDVLGPEVSTGGRQVLGFALGDAAPAPHARNLEITYRATVADEAGVARGTSLVNTAVARWNRVDRPDPITSPRATWDRSGDPGTATVTVIEPQVTVGKTVTDATPEPGDTFGYQLTVRNGSGPQVSDAHDIVITDEVPSGVVVDEASLTHGGTYDAGERTVRWVVAGPLGRGSTQALGYQATLAPSATLTRAALVNQATVASYESRPEDGRTYTGNTASAPVTPQFPRLTTTKSALSGSPAYLGTEVTWRIVTTNTGGGRAVDVAVSDTLPTNWTYVADSSRLNGAPLADPVVSGPDQRELAWTFDPAVELPPGAAATVEYRAIPRDAVVDSPGIGRTVSHTNAARSRADDASGAPGNAEGPYGGSGTATSRIHAVDLRLTKAGPAETVAGPAETVAGQDVQWSVRVSNPPTAHTTSPTDVAVGPFTVVDTLPAGTTYVSATGTGWSCSYDAEPHQVTCHRSDSADTLASGATFSPITITAAVGSSIAAGTTYTNQATVEGRTFERAPADNTASHTTTVITQADLSVTKTRPGGAPALAGAPLSYAIQVANQGSSTARSPLTVVDQLPPGVSFVSAGGTSDWACGYDTGAHAVTCTWDRDVTVGEPPDAIPVHVHVAAGTTGHLDNTVTVSSPTTDPTPHNNTATDRTPVETRADLRITKAALDAPVVAGETGSYRLRVDNDGPSDAAGVTVVDALPDGMSYAGSSRPVVGSWSCGPAAEGLACTLDGTLPAGGHATVDVVVRADTDLLGDHANTATVTSSTTDPNPGNNTDTESSAVTGQADLRIAKTAPATVAAGERLTYQVAVSNAGPSDSVSPITVTDPLPAGVSFVGASGTGWSCAPDGSRPDVVVTCGRAAPLAGGTPGAPTAAPVISIVVDVDPGAGPATLVNHSSVQGTTTDPEPGNNAATRSVTVEDRAELSITKTASPNPVRAGGTAQFEVVVTNDGPSTADQVTVTDVLPAGLVATGASGTGWVCNATPATTVSCTQSELEPGRSSPLTITAEVASGVPDGASLTNVVTVASATGGDDPDDNTAQAVLDVIGRADLAVTKSHGEDVVSAGEDVVFRIEVHNHGPSDSAGPVTIADALPAGFRYAAHDGPWTCVAGASSPTGQPVTCELTMPASLVAGTAAPALLLRATVSPDAEPSSQPDTYVNRVSVSSGTEDPNPGNDDARDPVAVDTATDLSLTKEATGPARVGNDLTFRLRAHNAGPSVAHDVQVADGLPASLGFVSAAGDGWTCDHVDGTVTCRLDDPLDAGREAEPIEITATVAPDAHPAVTNTAVVSSSTTELDDRDNTATTTVDVPPLVDLAIDKAPDGDFVVGEEASYTLTITNDGPTPTAGPITVLDELPTGLTPVAATPASGCVLDGTTVRCELVEPLGVGEQRSVSITVSVGPEAAPSVANTATVSTPDEETSLDDNHDTVVTPVTPTSRLALVKELREAEGGEATWVITVTNEGPNVTSIPLTVTDPLPAGLTFSSAGGGGWDCPTTDPVLTCTFAGELSVGGSTSLEIVTRVDAGPGATITNTATVEGGSILGRPSSGSGELTLPPAPPPPGQPGGDGTAGASASPSPLPRTGTDVAWLLSVGVSLALAGVGLLRVRRRRPTTR